MPPSIKEPTPAAGDTGWRGLNMRLEPGNLPPGFYSEGINVRCRDGVVETRRGSMVLPWLNRVTPTGVTVSAYSDAQTVIVTTTTPHGLVVGDQVTMSGFSEPTFNGIFTVLVYTAYQFIYAAAGAPTIAAISGTLVTGTGIKAWGTVYGRGLFRDPTTFLEYVLIAADGNVYATLANNPSRALPLPSGESVLERCTFVQCFNVVVLLRGFDHDPLVMSDITVGFQAISMSLEGTGTLPIPKALRGVFAANRLFLAREDDSMVASDTQDYTHFSEFNDFRVNQGADDKIVALKTFGSGTIVVLKSKSVFRIDQIYRDLAAATFSSVTQRYGCVAADTVVDCGSDLLWLSQEGVASLTLTEQNEVQAGQGALAGKNKMFSEDIGPLIGRVNGSYMANAFATLYNDRYYLALPDGNTAVLGPERAPVGWGSAVTSHAGVLVVPGHTYRWASTGGETLTNGAVIYTSARDFVASGTSVTLNQTTIPISSSIREVLATGTPDILVHYDFQNAAWGGYDSGDGLTFKEVFTASYLGKLRLFVIGADGFVRLWEEGYADRLAVPYTELVLTTTNVHNGDTVRVNNGTVVTANGGFDLNLAGGLWGVLNGMGPGNIFTDGFVYGGFYTGATAAWTAPDTFTAYVANGVRFYGTNGVLPVVVYTLADESETTYTLTQTVEQPILMTWVSRGYRLPAGQRTRVQWVDVDMETWAPSFTVSLRREGASEDTALCTARTKSRTAYYRPWDAAAWVATNASHDHATAHREDYSILQSGPAWTFSLGDGVRTDLHQSAREIFRTNGLLSPAPRLMIVNSQGRLRLSLVRLRLKPQAESVGSRD